ncbi:two component transcriptional regulator, LytTR family [Salinimicrobium sediminis]|uniref:Two component transcriptional regulator, LytTR family n=1 Tax=Salinimicrobium sediminis TaxID=1343891 RepID=A0A285X2N0_9FLAO|nr:LytTR family DNA-binding domain-containing protein [Salinimicrobium sediminis]SOC79611.1 two component transcriptional regulator, LytTR family [Salinimicrobium sediminis]
MRTVIIEDEAFAADALENQILQLRPNAQILEKLESVEESVKWLKTHEQPDVLFCDIHLSDGSSFEIFKQVDLQSPVIFTTAFDEFAIEAFKVNSVDYLLKPIKKDALERSIKKHESLQQGNMQQELENIRNLLRNGPLKPSVAKKSRFMVKSGQSIKVIQQEEIAFFLAEEGIVLLVNFDKQRFVIDYTLDQLEEKLDPEKFFRANRQLIVSINAVARAEPYFKGRLLLQTEPSAPGDQVISSNKASAFKKWLDL